MPGTVLGSGHIAVTQINTAVALKDVEKVFITLLLFTWGVVSDSSATPWTVALRLLCPWDFPGKNSGVGCHFLLQGIFLTQGWNPHLLPSRQILYCRATREACLPHYHIWKKKKNQKHLKLYMQKKIHKHVKSIILGIWGWVGYVVLYIVPCFLFLKSFQFACISVIIKIYFKESNSSSLSKFWRVLNHMKREEGLCTRGNKMFPKGTKRLGLALLLLTLNCLWNSQSKGFPEGIEWRWETTFVALFRNIKHQLQRKGHREPVQLGLRLWQKTALSSAPVKLGHFEKRYWPFWTSVSPSVNGNKYRNCIIGGLPWWYNG